MPSSAQTREARQCLVDAGKTLASCTRPPGRASGLRCDLIPSMSNLPNSETFTASRWTKGNLFFPVRIIVTREHVSRVKSRLFGSNEESIALGKVASVQISTGVIWSNIRIDSSGGTAPITSHGHRKADGLRIRELIEGYQAEQRK